MSIKDDSSSEIAAAIEGLHIPDPPTHEDYTQSIIYVGDMISDVALAIRYLADSIKKD